MDTDSDSEQHELALSGQQWLHRPCAAVAAAVVAHAAMPEAEARSLQRQLPHVCACSLAVLSECGKILRQVPLVEHGTVRRGRLAAEEALSQQTAAWRAYQRRETLAWTRSRGQLMVPDWRAVLRSHPRTEALMTVPLLYSEGGSALGSATFALTKEPSTYDLAMLEVCGRELGQHIAHETKHLWEMSLGFINQVVPQVVVSRMLSAAVAAGPLLPPATPLHADRSAPGQAAARPAMALPARAAAPGAAGGEREAAAAQQGNGVEGEQEPGGEAAATGSPGLEPATPSGHDVGDAAQPPAAAAAGLGKQGAAALAAAPSAAPAEALADEEVLPQQAAGSKGEVAYRMDSAMEEGGGPAAAMGAPAAQPLLAMQQAPGGSGSCKPRSGFEYSASHSSELGQPAAPLAFVLRDISLEDMPPQKWTLEFCNPRQEESYKSWFNGRHAVTDLLVFRSYALMVLMAVAGLFVRGSLSHGALAVCAQVLATVALPAYLMLTHTTYYIKHRSLIVASVRIASCITVLVHSFVHPELYSDSLLKALCGKCVLSMALNTFRNRLRFTSHLMSQLIKLYMCASINAFIYSDPARASQQFLTLGQTTAVQLVAVLLPSLALYRMEARAQRAFVQRQGEMG